MNFYFQASKLLDRLDAKQGSIQSTISSVPEKDRKRTAALVIETLKYKAALVEIINGAGLMTAERKKLTSLNLALLLVHDLLLAHGIQAGDGPIKQAVLRHKTRLNAELGKLKIRRGVKNNQELAATGDHRADEIPRYVRVNTLVWSIDEAVDAFISRGFILSHPFHSKKAFAKDVHVPNLLAFNPEASFSDDPFLESGKIILQDKASCLPALVLSPPASEATYAIDATSAPGNKTSHLAAIMQNRGKLYALERDRKRFSTLKTMLARAKCQNTETINADFLTIDPSDEKFSNVTHILLDPSCSGSGIVNRLDHLLSEEETPDSKADQEDRLNKLASFQLSMICHAMKFPSVLRIVYSTCSIHAQENEHVVKAAVESDEAQSRSFRIASKTDVLPQWPRRGLGEEMTRPEDALGLVRCIPGEDKTNGFFVSCFIRDVTGKRKSDDRPGHRPNPKRKKMKK